MKNSDIPAENEDSKYNVPMLFKGMELLELLAAHPSGLTLQELVDTLHYSKTSLFRMTNSFMEMGYVGRKEETSRFFLSRKLFRLGLSVLGEANIVERSLQPMRKLRDQIKEAVMLGTLMGNEAVLLEQVLGSHNFSFILQPGTRFSLYSSAPGKVLLAYLAPQEQEEIIQNLKFKVFNEHTIRNKKQLKEELQLILRQGYAIDREEELTGVHCIAAPIFNPFGNVTAAIWTSGPSGRMPAENFPVIAAQVIRTAQSISALQGYSNR